MSCCKQSVKTHISPKATIVLSLRQKATNHSSAESVKLYSEIQKVKKGGYTSLRGPAAQKLCAVIIKNLHHLKNLQQPRKKRGAEQKKEQIRSHIGSGVGVRGGGRSTECLWGGGGGVDSHLLRLT